MTAPDPVKAAPATPQLAPGTLVAGRFAVERTVTEDALGVVVAAKDQKTGKAVSLRLFSRTVVRDAKVTAALRAEVMKITAISHRSLVAAYGIGADPKLGWYLASEWSDGETLATLVARRRAEGSVGMSLRGAYNVAAHVAAALALAHARQVSHGGVRPSVVWIAKGGRVKLGDLGVAGALLATGGAAILGADEQAWLAPEVKAGQPATVRSDVFGLGALLYAMLTGRSPSEEFIAPSQAAPDASAEVDAIVLRALSPDPALRFATPEEVRVALRPLAAATAPAGGGAAGDIDVDVDVDPGSAPKPVAAAGRPAPPPARPSGPGRPAPPGRPDAAPRVGQRVSVGEQFRTSMPSPTPSGGGPVLGTGPMMGPAVAVPSAPAAPDAQNSAMVDLGSLLAKISENDAPRWMVQKDKLDHGPFTGRELVQAILKGDVRDEHGLLNMDTGERRKVRGFPEFIEFLDQFKIRQQETAQAAALERSDKVDKASNAAKVFVALGVLGVVVLAIGGFIYTRQKANNEQHADANLADLYERGQIQITGTAGILPPPPRGGGGHHGGGGGGGHGGGNSYEEAMNQAVNLGNAANGGGEQQLSPQTVAGVMNGHLQSLYGCVGQELRSGGHIGSVQIDLAIAGSGQVLGASVHGGSGAFQSCIAGRTRGVHFPAFSAPRMGARYSFSVD